MAFFNWFGQGKAAAVEGGEPALTPEGAAHGLSWNTGAGVNFSADLWHKGKMMAGVFDNFDGTSATVDVSADGYGPESSGEMKTLGGIYPTLEDGMRAAEEHTLHEIGAVDVQPLVDVSESYYAKLADLAESRGAEMEVRDGLGQEDSGLDR